MFGSVVIQCVRKIKVCYLACTVRRGVSYGLLCCFVRLFFCGVVYLPYKIKGPVVLLQAGRQTIEVAQDYSSRTLTTALFCRWPPFSCNFDQAELHCYACL